MSTNAHSTPHELKPGVLLIAQLALEDPNFKRTGVLLCEHDESGSFGLVLNRPLEMTLSEVMDDVYGWDAPLYIGGPVQPNTIHVLHRLGHLVPDALLVSEGLWWGGSFETIKDVLQSGTGSSADVRFFLGYAGWGPGQLQGEYDSASWLLGALTGEQFFDDPPERFWSRAVKRLGGDYAYIAHFPENPQLN